MVTGNIYNNLGPSPHVTCFSVRVSLLSLVYYFLLYNSHFMLGTDRLKEERRPPIRDSVLYTVDDEKRKPIRLARRRQFHRRGRGR